MEGSARGGSDIRERRCKSRGGVGRYGSRYAKERGPNRGSSREREGAARRKGRRNRFASSLSVHSTRLEKQPFRRYFYFFGEEPCRTIYARFQIEIKSSSKNGSKDGG